MDMPNCCQASPRTLKRGLFSTAVESTRTDYAYVGMRGGAYEADLSYSYVGQGGGSFEKEQRTEYTNWRLRPCTWSLVGVLFIALGVLALGGVANFGGHGEEGPCGDEDCMCGFAQGWTKEKQLWCCHHKGMGCTPDGSVNPLPGIGKLASTLQGCSTQCLFKGISADCAARVKYAAQHRFVDDADRCESAYTLVNSQCSFCETCPLASIGCNDPPVHTGA